MRRVIAVLATASLCACATPGGMQTDIGSGNAVASSDGQGVTAPAAAMRRRAAPPGRRLRPAPSAPSRRLRRCRSPTRSANSSTRSTTSQSVVSIPRDPALVLPPHAARQPVGPDPARLRDARSRDPARGQPHPLVCEPGRVHRPHGAALATVSVPHRRGNRAARHADRTRAAAVRRERVPAGGDLHREGGGPVAVHPVDGQGLRPRAEHVARRAPRRDRVDPRRARLPAEAVRHVRRLAPCARLLQLGRGRGLARHREEPPRRQADRLHEPEDAEGDGVLRAEAAGHQEHRFRARALGRCAAADR